MWTFVNFLSSHISVFSFGVIDKRLKCPAFQLPSTVDDRFVCCIVLQRTAGDITKELRRTARIARNKNL